MSYDRPYKNRQKNRDYNVIYIDIDIKLSNVFDSLIKIYIFIRYLVKISKSSN